MFNRLKANILFNTLLRRPNIDNAYKMVGFDGGYLRFEGKASIEKIVDRKVVETACDPAVWELMYFGHACADEIYKAKKK